MQQALERPGPEDYSPDSEKLLKVALKLLRRALKALGEERPESGANLCTHSNLGQAIYSARATLKNIRQEKEEKGGERRDG